MNKILWLSVGLISMVSLHGMHEDDTTALRVSMACGFATGAGVVGRLGSMAVDYYEKTIDQNNKRSWDDDDSKIEASFSVIGIVPALIVMLAVTDPSNHTLKEIFPDNNIQNAFLVGLAAGAITGGSLVCVQANTMKYDKPQWEYVGAHPSGGYVWKHVNHKS